MRYLPGGPDPGIRRLNALRIQGIPHVEDEALARFRDHILHADAGDSSNIA